MQAVPDDQDAAVVAVEVHVVAAVVRAVVAGRVEDVLDGGRQAAYPFGVDEELVQEVPRLREQHHPRREAQQGQDQPERQGGHGHPGLPQRGGQVVVLAGVMHDVTGPEQPDLVADAVVPVVRVIVREEQQHPHPPRLLGQAQRREAVQRGVDRHDDALPQQIDQDVPDAHAQAGDRVARPVPGVLVRRVVVVTQVPVRGPLDQQGQQEDGDRGADQVKHGAPPTAAGCRGWCCASPARRRQVPGAARRAARGSAHGSGRGGAGH